MYKTMIAPIIAALALVVQLIFGVTVGEELQNQVVDVIANGIFVGVVIYGIIKNHKKKGENE
jgi:hypothetical protein